MSGRRSFGFWGTKAFICVVCLSGLGCGARDQTSDVTRTAQSLAATALGPVFPAPGGSSAQIFMLGLQSVRDESDMGGATN